MTLPSLLRPSYWFTPVPPPFLPWVDRVLLIVFSVLFVVGIVVFIVSLKRTWDKLTRKAIRRAAHIMVGMGALGLLLYGLTYERIYLLSARVGYLVWFAVCIWLVWRLVHFINVEIPAMEQRRAEFEQRNKWLPKAKK